MDRFTEQVVIKQKRAMSEIAYAMANVVMVVSGLTAMFMLQLVLRSLTVIGVVITLVFAGIAVGLWFVRPTLRTEYEYTFTNGELDFAMVFNNQKRKSLGTLKVANVEAFGKVSGNDFQRYVSMPGIKKFNWFLNREAELYYFYFQKESNKRLIILEPNDEIVDYIRHYLPMGAWKA